MLLPRAARRAVLAGLVALPLLVPAAPAQAATTDPPAPVTDPTAYVDPFVGTGSGGSTVGEINAFPGPAAPFGMLQWSPDTEDSYSGYQYANDRIRGFSLTHASVGCSQFGDVRILPTVGAVGSDPESTSSRYSHDEEQASPGYYAVTLQDSGVRAELTATTRTGLGRFTFPPSTQAQFLVKGADTFGAQHGGDVRVVDDRTLEGSETSGGFCGAGNTYTIHWSMTFDRPFTAHGSWGGDAPGAYVTFDTTADRTVEAKVAASFVSTDGARANAGAEVPGWDFDAVRADTRARWRDVLSRITVGGGTEERRRTFYTMLYHSLLHPNTFNDVDGRYVGFDDEVHSVAPGHTQYANFSAWDTYRSLAPLQGMLVPDIASDMAQSLVNDAQQGGYLPRWPVYNGYTAVMNGDSAAPLIANLHAFGARDLDVDAAVDAMVKSASSSESVSWGYVDRVGTDDYANLGYVPNERAERGHVWKGASETLEYAVDDFAVSRLAASAGRADVAAKFAATAQNWRNVYDPTTDYLRPRDAKGEFPAGPGFVPPGDGQFGQDGFEEGNAEQYRFFVPQDMAGLVSLMGGREKAASIADAFFAGGLNSGPNVPFMWAGNEVNFVTPWVYDYLGRPSRTQDVVRTIQDTLFGAVPDGEPGNDDLGAQSSWYVWSALGMYPVTSGTAYLAVNTPLFPSATITLAGGKRITMTAPGAGDARYVTGLTVDGAATSHTYLPESLATSGGTVDFSLGTSPSTTWGTAGSDAPPSWREHENAFQTIAQPEHLSVAPGGAAGAARLDVRRLEGGATGMPFTVHAEPGVTVTPSSGTVPVSGADGSGSLALHVSSPSGTSTGYRDVTVSFGTESTRTFRALVAPADGLLASYDRVATIDDGQNKGGFDDEDWAFSRQSLAAHGLARGKAMSVPGTGLTFTLPEVPAGLPDAVGADGQTIQLPLQKLESLSLVGSGANGDQGGTVTVTYTDGSSQKLRLTFNDWALGGGPESGVRYGNIVVGRGDYRVQVQSNTQTRQTLSTYVFATAPHALDASKVVHSITLPKNPNFVVLGVATEVAGGVPAVASLRERVDALVASGGVARSVQRDLAGPLGQAARAEKDSDVTGLLTALQSIAAAVDTATTSKVSGDAKAALRTLLEQWLSAPAGTPALRARIDALTASGDIATSTARDLQATLARGDLRGLRTSIASAPASKVSAAAKSQLLPMVDALLAPPPVLGDLSDSFTGTGIGDEDQGNADFDGDGWFYSRSALADRGIVQGKPLTVPGTGLTYTLPAVPAGTPDHLAARGQTIDLSTLPAGTRRLSFVGSAHHGDAQATATLTYADGSTQTVPLEFGDWALGGDAGAQPRFGDAGIVQLPYRASTGGGHDDVSIWLFATPPTTLSAGTRLVSVTLPDEPRIAVFSVAYGS
ncbi:putative alpha-1,2-mannosidase [Motilibacter peucedani]|uniref:Putative alpha-1,2-mannosidase n=1 Tax=Motilibacter peucedani TaxID=598650 RepID=A0A420XL36_9ACTN|nr:GH92 family glycosyl hydrolase [Motilibacter peucedani]RKS68547.1 putative alpha-1,2-mannosidase [Motilibacter peucedani]